LFALAWSVSSRKVPAMIGKTDPRRPLTVLLPRGLDEAVHEIARELGVPIVALVTAAVVLEALRRMSRKGDAG